MLIECNRLEYQLFIPFIFPIFLQIKTFISTKYKNIEDNPFYKLFRLYLSYLLSAIFLLIIKLRTKIHKKRKSKQHEQSILNNESNSKWINPLDLQKKLIMKEKKFKNYLFILILIFMGFLSNISIIFFNKVFSENNEEIYVSKQSIGIILKIIFFILLSKMILKMKIYKHHIISLEIIAFTSLFLAICITIYYKYSTFQASIYHILTSFFFCLFDVLGKKYLNIFCSSPFQIMLKIGIVSVILFFIYDLIVFIIKGDEETNISGVIIGIKNNFNLVRIIFIIIDIILDFFWNAGIWITLYYLTPCHFILSESLSEYLYYLFDFISNSDNYQIMHVIIYGIVYIINFFFFLVYDEIIILNFCNLNKYTKKMIQHRETIDTNLSSNNSNNELFESTNTNMTMNEKEIIPASSSLYSINSLLGNDNENENDSNE